MSDASKPVVLLVDGHSIANRAFYGLPLLSNSKGVYTNALHGFFNILWRFMDSVSPTHLAVAFDLKAPTFRHQMYEAYKGTRQGMPEELLSQIPLLEQMLRAAGVPLLMQEGYEADDLLGTLSKQEGAKGHSVYILSGDRDLLQLVDEQITLLIPKTKKNGTEIEVYGRKEVEEKYGVSPEGYLQMKALMGDSSDNIPGVSGIGEKTAAEIIRQFGTLENAIAHAGEVKPPRASKNLIEQAEVARLSLQLATIDTHANAPLEALPVEEKSFASDEFIDLLKLYELKNLLGRVLKLKDKEKENTDDPSPQAKEEVPLAKVAPEKILEEKPPVLGLYGLYEDDGSLCALGLADPKSFAVTEEISQPLLERLSALLSDASVRKVTFDGKRLIKAILARGVEVSEAANLDDLMVKSYLLNATKGRYSPDELSVTYLSRTCQSEGEVRGQGAKRLSWLMVDESEKRAYLAKILSVLMESYALVEKEIEAKELTSLYQDIEEPLISTLAFMEHRGIGIEASVLEEIGKELTTKIQTLERQIYELSGHPFNIQSPKQLGEVLFEELMLPAGKKTKTGYSTSAEVLEGLIPFHPIISLILSYRQLSKLESTYVEGLKPYIGPDCRIHSSFQQTVTATGRLSCTDPNLQNIPVREEMGRELRRAFVPKSPDYLFMDADYSQIELRLLAHMAKDEALIEAYRSGADIHRLTASQVLHIPYEEVTKEERSSAKAVNFGIVYGISAFSLAGDLHISTKEAQDYIDRYFQRFPGVKAYLEESVAAAKESGYAKTLYHRIRKMDELKSKSFQERSFGERVARNMPIQGTAADIIKIAMVRVEERLRREGLLSRLILQVHDELLLEVYRPETEKVEQLLKEEMEGAASLLVPLSVDVHTGENWYEAK